MTKKHSHEGYDDFYSEEGYAAAADASIAPLAEDVWVATVRYPILGRTPELVVGKSEAQAKASLLKYWRWTNRRCRGQRELAARAHAILIGFDPADFSENYEGLPFKVKCWDDLRRVCGASVYPLAFGEVCVHSRVQNTGDLVSDTIKYLEVEDIQGEEPLT